MQTTSRAEDGVWLGAGAAAPAALLRNRLGQLLRPQRLERDGGVLGLEEFVVRIRELAGLAIEVDLLESGQRHPPRRLLRIQRLVRTRNSAGGTKHRLKH